MPLIEGENREILHEASKLTQDIGRKIASPKNDQNDLLVLSNGLKAIAETLETVQETITVQNS